MSSYGEDNFGWGLNKRDFHPVLRQFMGLGLSAANSLKPFNRVSWAFQNLCNRVVLPLYEL